MKSKNLESKWINEEDKKLIIESKNGNKNAIYRIIKKYEKMIFWVLNKEINTTEIYKRNETRKGSYEYCQFRFVKKRE